jgi:muramoyltetrapeptide carboxypeptidase
MPISQKVIKPNSIQRNNTIALIAPAGPVSEEQLSNACKRFEDMGFKVTYKQRILDRTGYLAGNDNDRLDELHEAFENEEVDVVMCIRGGYGSNRIIEKIDFELIKSNPKIFIGFSDITALLNAIWQKTGLVTFHGVVGNSGFAEYTKKIFLEILTCSNSGYELHPFNNTLIASINQGKASGQLVGGNLSLINSLIGTNYEIDFTDKLVFLEDIDEAPYRIDRMLTQLLLTGKLKKASGLILGDFRGCDVDSLSNPKNSFTLSEVFHDRLEALDIPVITGFSFGHIENQAIFPIGVTAEIDTQKPFIKLLENSVI